jgi:hypothetical protein
MPANLNGLLWLLLLTGPLLLLQRSLHREIQAVLLILTRRPDLTRMLFSVLFFPGIFLHEGSHYIMARLLGVRTGRFSLLPRPLENGKLQLGFVETAQTDWLRDALIGAAPLLTGGLFVAFAGLTRLGLGSLWQTWQEGGARAAFQAIPGIFEQPDFWLWFYLAFAVSSTMLPSASDRRAWLPLAVVVVLIIGLSIMAGAGPWLASNLAPLLNLFFGAVAAVFAISLLLHAILLLPCWSLRKLLCWWFKVSVEG